MPIGLAREYFGVMTEMRSNRAGGTGTENGDDGVYLCQYPQRD